MNRLILFIFFSIVSIQGKTQGGLISIPANVQDRIVEYVYEKNLTEYEKRFSFSEKDGKEYVWEVGLEKYMTSEICIFSPEKLVRDDSLAGRVIIIYKSKDNEVNIILWIKDKDGDAFGALLEKIPKKEKKKIVRKADLSGFQERFKNK